MKYLSFFIASLITISAFAQQSTSVPLAREPRLSNLSINKLIDNMPTVTVGPTNQVYLYNNGTGLDVYKSQPDNMSVLKPDAGFYDNMGIKKIPNQTFLDIINANKPNQFQPSGNAKFNFVFPSKKDSIAFLDSIKTLQFKPKF